MCLLMMTPNAFWLDIIVHGWMILWIPDMVEWSWSCSSNLFEHGKWHLFSCIYADMHTAYNIKMINYPDTKNDILYTLNRHDINMI